ncbi:hypothetical protein Bca4012_011529 [Brassica carinata]
MRPESQHLVRIQELEEKLLARENPEIKNPVLVDAVEVADGPVSVKDASPEFDSKNKTLRKARESPSGRVLVSSGKKKRSARSPSTIGVTLRQRNLLAGIGSPKPISSSHGLNVSVAGQKGPIPKVSAIQQGNNSKVASGRPPKVP